MRKKIAINGFGRIGRLTLRAFLERNIENLEVLAINDLGDVQSNIHLYEYDSVHGRSSEKIEQEANKVKISDFKIEFFSYRGNWLFY